MFTQSNGVRARAIKLYSNIVHEKFLWWRSDGLEILTIEARYVSNVTLFLTTAQIILLAESVQSPIVFLVFIANSDN